MIKLEAERQEGIEDENLSLIIPIILSGKKHEIPNFLKERIYLDDFMEFKVAGFEKLGDDQEQEFKKIVFKIAESITELVQSLEEYEEELENFELLAEDDPKVKKLVNWKRIAKNQSKTNFPN